MKYNNRQRSEKKTYVEFTLDLWWAKRNFPAALRDLRNDVRVSFYAACMPTASSNADEKVDEIRM